MWKKVFIGLVFMAASISITFIFYNHSLNAATNINVIEEGEQVIVGKGNDGNEVVWTVNKNNGNYYMMYHGLESESRIIICNLNTNNSPAESNGWIKTCDFVTTAAGKSHSPGFIKANSFNTAYGNSIAENLFERASVQTVSGKVGNLQYAYVPSASDIVSGDIGLTALPELLMLSEKEYARGFNGYMLVAYKKAAPSSTIVYPGPTSTTPYPNYIAYFWWKGTDWARIPVIMFSHLDKSDILYVLNSDNNKNTLTSNPRSGVLKIRYADSGYTVSFNDLKYNNISLAGRKVAKDSTIQIDAVASDTLTVFVYDETGNNLLYYKALDDNNFDLTGIPVGKYKIAVANEEFDDLSLIHI